MATTTKKKPPIPAVVEGTDSVVRVTVNGNSAAHEYAALQYLADRYNLLDYTVNDLSPDADYDSDNYVYVLERIGL